MNPIYTPQAEMIETAITFLDLVNLRLDYVEENLLVITEIFRKNCGAAR
jgi:hypothetical protein